jgi:hypothetical protein
LVDFWFTHPFGGDQFLVMLDFRAQGVEVVMTTKDSSTSSVQVLHKTVKVLDRFSPEHPALSLAEIRRLTGFPATTVNRLVNTMLANDVLPG